MNKDKCDRCFEVYEWVTDDEDLYKYEDKLYCWDCLESKLHNDNYIFDVVLTKYYRLGGIHIGDVDDIEKVIKKVVDRFDIEVIKKEKENEIG